MISLLNKDMKHGTLPFLVTVSMFNVLLDTYLKIFYSSFPLKKVQTTIKRNGWITMGIKTSCKYIQELHNACRNSNNPGLRNYYKKYCKTLSTVIKEATRLKYDSKIKKSNNQNTTM
jgi:hypothetical protein